MNNKTFIDDIILTPKQDALFMDCIDWYKSPSRRENEPVYPFPGVAGSGKSTLISKFYREVGLEKYNVAYVAYTGMASCVLIRKGIPAMTIHRFIYNPFEVYDKSAKMKVIRFKLKKREEIDPDIKLIIVDEGSMVSEKLMNDLISFNIPIILAGDPFQLKPVFGKMNNHLYNAKYFLDEPLRQSLDNPIIYISDQIRKGNIPKIGTYGDKVRVYSRNNFPEDILIQSDQIMAGTNKTCQWMNKFYRKFFNNTTLEMPVKNDKLMCIRNNWKLSLTQDWLETYLVNGLIGNMVHDPLFDNLTKTFKFDFKPTFMDVNFHELLGDKLTIKDSNVKDENYVKENYPETAVNRIRLYNNGTVINKFIYAYCVTVYKMQGSQVKRAVYIDEMLRKDIYLNHFYTAVTRAEEEIDIII